MNDTIKYILELEKEGEWLQSKYNELRYKFGDQFVAVKDEKIIANGKDIKNVIEKVKKAGEDPALTLIEFIFKNKVELIL